MSEDAIEQAYGLGDYTSWEGDTNGVRTPLCSLEDGSRFGGVDFFFMLCSG